MLMRTVSKGVPQMVGKRFRRWIETLDAWEERVTQPNYPGWLSASVGVIWALAGFSLVLTLGALLLFNFIPGLLSLLQPLQPLGEVLGFFAAGLMIVSMMLFLLFLLHVFFILLAYTFIACTRGTLESLLAFAQRFR